MHASDSTDDGMWDTNRLEALISNVPGAIYRCSPESDWAMQFLSDEIEAISGHPAAEFIGSAVRTFASVIHADDRELVEHCVGVALERHEAFELEYRLVHADGSTRWVYERGRGIFDAAGEVRFLDGAIFDITARKQAEERLSYLAYHDALTDLPNRTLFQEHLATAIATADRTGVPAAVLYADLDDFKLINDNFGHGVGDRLLIEVAAAAAARDPRGGHRRPAGRRRVPGARHRRARRARLRCGGHRRHARLRRRDRGQAA